MGSVVMRFKQICRPSWGGADLSKARDAKTGAAPGKRAEIEWVGGPGGLQVALQGQQIGLLGRKRATWELWGLGCREQEVDRRPGLGRQGCRLICSHLHVGSLPFSSGERKAGGYSIEQGLQTPAAPQPECI